MTPLTFSLVVLGLVMLVMAGEASISRRNETALRARGAIEPADDVYRTMRWGYPASFIAMTIEGAMFGDGPGTATMAGAVLMLASKALKFLAMGSLGDRWTFKVLVVPEPLVAHGPYVWLRHPNYVAVVGELASMALLVGARGSGPMATLLFSLLIWRRIRVEDRALRHLTCS
jgi:methyltransferase